MKLAKPLFSVLLAACGSDSDSKPIDAPQSGPDAARADAMVAVDAAPATILEGAWQTTCIMGDGAPGTISALRMVSYSGNAYASRLAFFTDAACSVLALEFKETGTFALGAASMTVQDATDVDYTQISAVAHAHDGYAAMFNGTNICQVTLVDGQDVNMAGVACDGSTVIENGQILLSVFQLDTMATPDVLRLGATGEISFLGATTRPTVLEQRELLKQ